MMHTGRLTLRGAILVALVIAAFVSSCSRTGPLTPELSLEKPVLGLDSDQPGAHELWGEYLLTLKDVKSLGNVTPEYSIEMIPVRTSENHNNVTTFIIPPKCGDCFKAEILSIVPGDTASVITVEITLTNKSKFAGQDVRGIIFPTVPSGKCTLANPDGLTTLFDAGGNPPNPYMAFYDHASSASFRPFPQGESRSALYRFVKENDYKFTQLLYKVDASYPTPADEPVNAYLFPFTADDHIYLAGSHAIIQVRLTDWQNDISTVSLDLSSFKDLTGNEAMTKVSEDTAKYTSVWSYKLSARAMGDTGPRAIRLTAISSTPIAYNKDLVVNVTEDTDPPVWLDSSQKGIYDSISGPDALTLFFYQAWDVTYPIQYEFYVSSKTPVPFDYDHQQAIYYFYFNSYFHGDFDFPMNTANKQLYYAIGLRDGNGYFSPYMKYFKGARYSIDLRLSFIPTDEAQRMFGSPAIGDVNGDGRKDIVFGTIDGMLHVYDGSGTGTTGTVIWEYQTGGAIYCTPALVDLNGDKKLDVVVASDDRNVYAIDGSTGLPLWTPHSCGPGDYTMHGSPSIAQLDSGTYGILVGTGDGRLLALSGDDGSEIWSFVTTSGQEIDGTPGAADVTGDGIPDACFGSNDNFVYMVNGADGKLIWSYDVGAGPNNVDSSPVMVDISGDGIPDPVIGCSTSAGTGELIALDGAGKGPDGQTLWVQEGFTGNLNRPVAPAKINDDDVWDFIVTGGSAAEQFSYYAVDGADGTILYSYLSKGLSASTSYNYSAPVVGDFTADGHMKAIFGIAQPDVPDGASNVSLVNLPGFSLPGEFAGKELKQIQVASGNYSEVSGVPAVDDVNGDGTLDLVVCTGRGDVYIFDMHAPVPGDIHLRPWTCNQGNRWANGIPEFVLPDE
jgi:outer membrane protein assembly factor BamB